MKSRILAQIHALAEGEPKSYMESLITDLEMTPAEIQQRAVRARTLILHDYSRFTVLTIDKFFQRVLRAFIQEIGINIDYNLEIESSSIVAQSADALIEEITTDEKLRGWLMSLVQERIEQGRKWSVREGILSLESELFKEQARETLEKSRSKSELQSLIEQVESEAQKSIAKIREVANRAITKITQAGFTTTSFKGQSRSLAKIFDKIATSEELPDITNSQRENCSNIDKWCSAGSDIESIAHEVMPLLVEIVELYHSEMKRINSAKLLRENFRSFALMYDLYHKTQELCREQNTMLLSQTSRILESFVTENDAPFIYEKIGARYTHFMMDEFQDTSRREWDNFLPLLHNTLSEAQPTEQRIFIVGDIKQSIYRWRGGDWRILHSDAREQLGRENTAINDMADNYRSLPNIVEFNNSIIERIVAIEEEELGA